MDEILLSSMIRYFDTLENTGYVNDCEVERLLALCYAQEMLSEHYFDLPKEVERDVHELVYCILGTSCLFQHQECCM